MGNDRFGLRAVRIAGGVRNEEELGTARGRDRSIVRAPQNNGGICGTSVNARELSYGALHSLCSSIDGDPHVGSMLGLAEWKSLGRVQN